MILNKRQRRLRASLHGGTGAIVIDNDLSMALSVWRNEIKNSGIITELFERREYVKPSRKKKDMLSRAKHRQKKLTESQK